MLQKLALLALAGGMGSLARYGLAGFVQRTTGVSFPWGTFVANIAGSFIIGIVFAFAEKGNLMSAEWRMFFAVGICGGFTTFSSFAFNNLMMIEEKSIGQMLLNVGGSLFFGILAVYLGIILVRAIF